MDYREIRFYIHTMRAKLMSFLTKSVMFYNFAMDFFSPPSPIVFDIGAVGSELINSELGL